MILPRKTFLCALVEASVAELFAHEGAAHRGQHRQATRLAETSAAMKSTLPASRAAVLTHGLMQRPSPI